MIRFTWPGEIKFLADGYIETHICDMRICIITLCEQCHVLDSVVPRQSKAILFVTDALCAMVIR